MAKQRKQYNPKKHLQQNSARSDSYIVWSVEGFVGGVKSVATCKDVFIDKQTSDILMKTKHRFNIVVGVVVRNGVEEYIQTRHLTSTYCFGPELSEHFKQNAREMIDDCGAGSVLTSFYFATSNAEFEFDDVKLYRWLDDLGVFTKLVTQDEMIKQKRTDMSEKVATTNYKDRQIGGTHYSQFAIQPRDVINMLSCCWDIGNAVKYVTRHSYKNGLEDLRKASDYLQRLKSDGFEKYNRHIVTKAKKQLIADYLAQFEGSDKTMLHSIFAIVVSAGKDEQTFTDYLDNAILVIDKCGVELYGKTTL